MVALSRQEWLTQPQRVNREPGFAGPRIKLSEVHAGRGQRVAARPRSLIAHSESSP